MKEAPSSSQTWVLTRAIQRNIPEDTILHSHRPENLKSYIKLLARQYNCVFLVTSRLYSDIDFKVVGGGLIQNGETPFTSAKEQK
jgi:hypothetical protein